MFILILYKEIRRQADQSWHDCSTKSSGLQNPSVFLLHHPQHPDTILKVLMRLSGITLNVCIVAREKKKQNFLNILHNTISIMSACKGD
jgi:hypothetical protein